VLTRHTTPFFAVDLDGRTIFFADSDRGALWVARIFLVQANHHHVPHGDAQGAEVGRRDLVAIHLTRHLLGTALDEQPPKSRIKAGVPQLVSGTLAQKFATFPKAKFSGELVQEKRKFLNYFHPAGAKRGAYPANYTSFNQLTSVIG
jgi:hypothetical protein